MLGGFFYLLQYIKCYCKHLVASGKRRSGKIYKILILIAHWSSKMDIIFERRSIRKFTDKKITDEQLELILRAGMAAPTAENNQEWEFIIINNTETRQKIMVENEYAGALKTAPLAILICADMTKVSEPNENFWIQDLSVVSQNMLLQARSLDLGSLFMGLYKHQRDSLKIMLAIPENIEPLMLLAFGEAQKEKEKIERYLEDRVHFEKF